MKASVIRRVIKTLAVLIGEEEGMYICVPCSTALKMLEKWADAPLDNILNDLMREGSITIKRVGRGARICVKKDSELTEIRDFIYRSGRSNMSLEDFEKLFDSILMRLRSRTVTGFVDLGLVKDYMMKFHGVSEDLFVEYVARLAQTRRWKYAFSHGGSFRIKIGNVHVGLVKLVRV